MSLIKKYYLPKFPAFFLKLLSLVYEMVKIDLKMPLYFCEDLCF
ncbi:hypothetical protein FUAX_14780 [Fulvitalea axinellae]|uniref:Uncharacterized protein n=1 Tax=Fulvitalea axinellae TaxID=1182444 RepID=A0AAU9CJF1_9BACT|nr:hypothetical protein FUAX_14780 [Fulvitalea axinellae]